MEASLPKSRNPNPVPDGAPDPATYREAVRWLAHRLYLKSSRYQSQLWRSDAKHLSPVLAEFVQEYANYAARLGIPLHCDIATSYAERMEYVLGRIRSPEFPSVFDGTCCSVVHSVRGRDLPDVAWDVLRHLGQEVAAKLCSGVQWGGRATPWLWRAP